MKFWSKSLLRYRFERFMAKGGASIFVSLLIVYLVAFVLIVGLRLLIRLFAPDAPTMEGAAAAGFWHDLWYTFLQINDPGNMYYDYRESVWIKIATVAAGLVGIVVLSMLIAFITTQLEKSLYEFRRGRGPILERGHTLILGWNDRVVDIVRELVIANESERDAVVVVLAAASKETMDDALIKAIPDTRTTRVVTTHGNPASSHELERVRVIDARSVIVLASCSPSAPGHEKAYSDTQTVKAVLALIAAQGGNNRLPVIAEVFHEDRREVLRFFEDPNIIALDNWTTMGRLLVQTSLSSGLELVYNEILSFDGSEIYFYKGSWSDTPFGELAYHFHDGIPLGIYRPDGRLVLRPDAQTRLEADDELLILADDDSAIAFSPRRLYRPEVATGPTGERLEQATRRILILGWHEVARIFIDESVDYVRAGSVFDVAIENPQAIEAEIEALDRNHPQVAINLHAIESMTLDALAALEPFGYDSVLVLSRDPLEVSADKVDSDTLMTLLLLRRIARLAGVNDANRTKLITQVLDSDNQDLILQTEVDDFIISNKLITMILAQLSVDPRIRAFYDDIFAAEGSEIYLKSARLYCSELPCEIRFADAIAIAARRDEICLGIRLGAESRDARGNFGVRLNLPKGERIRLTGEDYFVVLAEDEH